MDELTKKELLKVIAKAPDDAKIWILTDGVWRSPTCVEVRVEEKVFVKGYQDAVSKLKEPVTEIRISCD